MTAGRKDDLGVPAQRVGTLGARDYQLLSEFRYLIRCFLEFSETAASRAGLTARQHQALLAIKGIREDGVPTVGYLAERLRIQHHSAVELADRLSEAGLVMREHDAQDRRRIRLELTELAERHLAELSTSHAAELQRMRPALLDILNQADEIGHGKA
jgi:DNA-binding MarR family transcriptional regulator